MSYPISPQFRAKVDQIARRLGTQPEYLLQVMYFETGGTFNAAEKNRAGSGATGLIQFMPPTAKGLGTTTAALARMSPEQQLDVVERYFQPYRGKLGSLQDTYMAVLKPAAIGKPATTPLFTKGTKAYSQNDGLDTEKKGWVTVADAVSAVGRQARRLLTPASAHAATLDALPDLPDRSSGPWSVKGSSGQLGAQAEGLPSSSSLTTDHVPPSSRTTAAVAPAPGAIPTADTQVELLQQQEQGRLALERAVGSPTVPAPTPAQLGTLAAATGIGALGGGLGAAAGTALGGPVGTVVGSMGGSYLARRANVALGLEEPGVGGDVASVALAGLPAVWPAVKNVARWGLGVSRVGKAIRTADDATAALQSTYREGVETAEQQYASELAQSQARIRGQEAERLGKVQQRSKVAQERQAQGETRREETAGLRERAAGRAAEEQTREQALEYAEQVQRYDQAVASQAQGVQTARTIAPRYTPETPAHVLYKKVADIAPEAPVTLTRTQDVAAELQDVVAQVPSLEPSRMARLLTDIRAARRTQSVREVQRYLSDLGTLTRSADSATRRTAKQLYGALHDDLSESASRLPETEAARDLLLQANATFRREMAARDLSRVIRRGITVDDEGRKRLAPGRVLTQFDRLVEEDRLFAGSFTPEELTQLRGELEGLTSAQRIPPRPGAFPPEPAVPRRVEPYTPRPFEAPRIPAGERVRPQTRPAMEGPPETWKARGPERPEPPVPVVPTLPKHGAIAKTIRTIAASAGAVDWMLGVPGPGQFIASAPFVADILSELLIRQGGQRYARAILNADGTINRAALMALAGGRAALMAEREKGQGSSGP